MKSHTYPPTRHFPEAFWGYSSIQKGKRPSLDPACLCSRWGTAETPGNVQLCSSYSRNTFQQTPWLLGPPLVLCATSQPDVQSALLSPWPLKHSVKLWENTRFCFKVYSVQPKTLEMTLILYFYDSFLKFILKRSILVDYVVTKECFLPQWTKCCISINASLRSQPIQLLTSPKSSPEADPSVCGDVLATGSITASVRSAPLHYKVSLADTSPQPTWRTDEGVISFSSCYFGISVLVLN